MGTVIKQRGRPKKNQTRSHDEDVPVELIMHLRDGGMVDYFAMARASGFTVNKVAEILHSHVGIPIKIRCNKCGGTITAVPCVACTNSQVYPQYKDPDFSEDTYEERLKLVHRLWGMGVSSIHRLADATGLLPAQIDDLIKREKLVRPRSGDGE